MKATTLKEAINILDPKLSLSTEEQIQNYFVDRPGTPLEEIKTLLESSDQPQKFLFTGHRGNGKSSELGKLRLEMQDQFYIIHYSIETVLDPNDLSHLDVLLSLGLELIKSLEKNGIRVNDSVVNHILLFTKEITKEIETGVSVQPEAGIELNLQVIKLSSKFGAESATRQTVREQIKVRLSDLIESINLLTKEIERVTKKRLLFIIEDLDKTDPETADKIFYGHSRSLTDPNVSIIYTFPIALRHNNNYMQMVGNFSKDCTFPNIKYKNKDGSPNEDGIRRLKSIMEHRLAPHLYTERTLERLAVLSGGIPRELIALGRSAFVQAKIDNKPSIEAKHVEKSVQERFISYQILLTTQQLDLLRAVHKTKKIDNSQAYRDLLHNLSILEYRNGKDCWNDVNPIIEPLLDA